MNKPQSIQEIAPNSGVADVFRLMASEDKGEARVNELRKFSDDKLNIIGRLSGVSEHQLNIYRAMIRNEDNEFTRGLEKVDGLLQPGDVILMTSNKILSKTQKFCYKKARSSHVALVHADFVCIDAMLRVGVSNRIISEVLADVEPSWRVIRHKSVNPTVTDSIMRACAFYLAQPYLIFPTKKSAKKSAYCSELARKIYRDVGVTESGIPDKVIIAPAHFDKLADEHQKWMDVTGDVEPAINFCRTYSILIKLSTKLFIDGLKLNQQRFKDRTKQLGIIQTLAKEGKITKEQAKEATADIREIEVNMNHTFWNVERKAQDPSSFNFVL